MSTPTQLVSGVDFVSLPTHDLDAAVEFFGTTLELPCSVYRPDRNFAEFETGNLTLQLIDSSAAGGGPGARGYPVALHVQDVDSAFEQAVKAGATVVRPLKDQFYGERSGTVRDPFGHEWLLGGHIEDVSTEEMQRRYSALFDK